MNKKRTLKFFFLSVFLCFNIFFISCSGGQKIPAVTSTTDSVQIQETTKEQKADAAIPEESESTPQDTEFNDSVVSETTDENKESKETGKEILAYKEKIIKIERINTIYEKIYTGSMELEIESETGSVNGFIFLGYMEVMQYLGKSYPCENVMKGSISGNLDRDSTAIKGEIKGEFLSEGKNCFSGTIIINFDGNILENGESVDGSFFVPSGNRIYFQLKKQE